MDANASIALRAAEAKVDTLAKGEKDGAKIKLVAGIVLDVVAAILHQWEAAKK